MPLGVNQPGGVRLADVMKGDEVEARLCTVPGVGPVTATSLASTLGNVSSFSGAGRVRDCHGLVPSEYSSGERTGSSRGRSTDGAAALWEPIMSLRLKAAHDERVQKDDENSPCGGSMSGRDVRKLLTSEAASQKSHRIHRSGRNILGPD
jgi:hypothetical protein